MQDFKAAEQLNASHIIHTLRFGLLSYPGQVHPLEGEARIDRKATGVDKYFIKVVPTEYKGTWGKITDAYQYSVTEYYTALPEGSRMMPGVYILYDTWPIQVNIRTMRLGILHLLVRACAVCGGVWAVAGMTDRIVHGLMIKAEKLTKMGGAP